MSKKDEKIVSVECLKGHGDWVLSCVYFPKPVNKLATSSWDKEIRIWDLETKKCDHVLKHHTDFIRHMIKMNDEVFLSCCGDKTILAFSIQSREILKTFTQQKSSVFRMLKLTDDLFISCPRNGDLLILSYSKNQIHRRLTTKQSGNFFTKLEKSFLFKNCFYQNSIGGGMIKKLVLLDYEKDRIMQSLVFTTNDKKSCVCWSLCVNKTKGNNEVVIAGGDNKQILMYFVHPDPKKTRLFLSIEIGSVISSLLQINHQYLCFGYDDGKVELLDLKRIEIPIISSSEKNKDVIVIPQDKKKYVISGTQKRIHSNKTYEHFFIPTSSGFKLFNLSKDFIISICDIQGLMIEEKDSYEEKDLFERVEFLRSSKENFLFNSEKEVIFSVNLRNLKLEDIFKSFF